MNIIVKLDCDVDLSLLLKHSTKISKNSLLDSCCNSIQNNWNPKLSNVLKIFCA